MRSRRLSAAFVAVAAIVGTSACAQMTVQVEILNTAYWATPEYIDSVAVAQIAESVQRVRDGRFAIQRDTMKRDIADTVQKMATPGACGADKPVVASQQVQRLQANLAGAIDREFGKAKAEFEGAFAKVQEASAATSQTARSATMNDAGNRFGNGAAIIAGVVRQIAVELRTNCQVETNAPSPPVVKAGVDKAQSVAEGLIGNAGILDDPRASAVVYAPDRYWERRLNDTICTGNFGNTDCAVKMEGLGSFTLKGVRLDATKITQATFSVAREAIQTVAAVYGVPVPKAAPAAGGQAADAASATPSVPDIQSPVKRQRDASTSLFQFRLARLAILDAISGQREALGNDATRDAAIAGIKAVFQANRPQLDPPAAQ